MKKHLYSPVGVFLRLRIVLTVVAIFTIAAALYFDSGADSVGRVTTVARANPVYFNMGAASLSLQVTPATVNQITSNDDWSGVNSVEGFKGLNLTATHGVDPQTILGTEFATNQLPNNPQNIAANKGNPSAFNAGGLAEFDSGTYLGIGFQGNVQANPYVVFYLNTVGRTGVIMNYTVTDLDGGSNNSVSQLALQYRVGESGLFTNLPAGFIADATDGGVAGRTVNMSVALPAAVNNQPKVQVRLITTNAANTVGGSTPDEWIGVNNVSVTSAFGPTAAGVNISGRVLDPGGFPVRGASVTMYDRMGQVRSALTSSFGYYSFSDVQVGASYNFIVTSKRYAFTPRTIAIVDELVNFDFVGDQ